MEKTEISPEILKNAKFACNRVSKLLSNKNKQMQVSIEDSVIVSLAANLLERADTVNFLAINNKEDSITVLTRSYIELSANLRFILKEKTKRRAESYYYYNKIELLKLQKTQLSLYTDTEIMKVNTPKETEQIKKDKKELEQKITFFNNKWIDLFSNFNKKTNNGKLKEQPHRKWYSLDWEHETFKSLLDYLEDDKYIYIFYYRLTSLDIHGSGAIGNIQKDSDNYTIGGSIPFHLCYLLIENYLISIIQSVINHYNLNDDQQLIAIFDKMKSAIS